MIADYSFNKEEKNKSSPTNSLKTDLKKLIKNSIKSNPELDNFLEKNKIKGRFIRSVTDRCICVSPLQKVRIIDEITESDPINQCIHWGSTTEGFAFWDNIHFRWRKEKKKDK